MQNKTKPSIVTPIVLYDPGGQATQLVGDSQLVPGGHVSQYRLPWASARIKLSESKPK
jgi:hypothetical protein